MCEVRALSSCIGAKACMNDKGQEARLETWVCAWAHKQRQKPEIEAATQTQVLGRQWRSVEQRRCRDARVK